MDRERLVRALRRLGELAVADGVELELSLYGGAVFTLVYGSRESTKDVDGLIRPAEVGRALVRRVAAEQGLPEDWINGDVAQFLAEREERRPYPKDDLGAGASRHGADGGVFVGVEAAGVSAASAGLCGR